MARRFFAATQLQINQCRQTDYHDKAFFIIILPRGLECQMTDICVT